jgi:hypothetical protein
MENRIEELKNDLGADGFCLNAFFATEAAFRSILLLFNLLAEFQRAAGIARYQQPSTLRAQVLTCGADSDEGNRRFRSDADNDRSSAKLGSFMLND